MSKDYSDRNLRYIKEEFLEYIHFVTNEIEQILTSEFSMPCEMMDYIIEMIRYNVGGGKMVRGLFAVYTVYSMCSEWSDDMKRQSFICGWCAELLQGAFLIADDIMDSAENRRGKPAWYKLKQVGMMSINDTFILQSLIFRLLQHNLPIDRCYAVLSVIEQIKFRTEIGQMLDLHTINPDTSSLNFNYFTKDYYMEIISNKTAYYTIFLPIYIGLVLCDCDKALLDSPLLKKICLQLGCFFQIKDDYLDVYADISVLGKEGTDIQEGKCSWVILTVLSICSAKDREDLQKIYGKNDSECVAYVREIFSKYDVEKVYLEYEEKTKSEVNSDLESTEFIDHRLTPVLQILSAKLFGKY